MNVPIFKHIFNQNLFKPKILTPNLNNLTISLKNYCHNYVSKFLLPTFNVFPNTVRSMATLEYMHRRGPIILPPKPYEQRAMLGKPFLKCIVIKPVIKKPKKPNSANRKCVKVRIIRTGKEIIAHVPGEGHNMQEHNVVLIKGGRLKDVPGIKHKVVRGTLDCPHIKKKTKTS